MPHPKAIRRVHPCLAEGLRLAECLRLAEGLRWQHGWQWRVGGEERGGGRSGRGAEEEQVGEPAVERVGHKLVRGCMQPTPGVSSGSSAPPCAGELRTAGAQRGWQGGGQWGRALGR